GWGNSNFQGLCPFDFTFYAAAVDENGKRDGTPDSLNFYVSGSPQIDSVAVPLVVVLAPKCPAALPIFCPDVTGISFGPDTLFLVGQHVANDPLHPLPGTNRFRLPFLATGHD